VSRRRTLLTVHAHPDDESSKGPATVARYHADGVQTVLVCCTGGEEGEILNPAMDNPLVIANLGEVRTGELNRAAAVIGYDFVEMLGYRDSGMAGSASNANPECFAQAPADEAVGRLVALFRTYRPDVVITYGDEQSAYPHPDHLRVHDISIPAFEAAGDPDRFPDAGEPWQPSKLYYTIFSVSMFREIHEKFVELGIESPFDEGWRARWKDVSDPPFTTSVDITGFADIRRQALLVHATQIDPNSKFWFGLSPEVMQQIHTSDEYQLARTAPGVARPPDGEIETDLFAGIPE